MHISLDTEILEAILTHAASGSRRAGCIADAADRALHACGGAA